MAGWANHDAVLRQLQAAGLVIAGPLKLATGKRSERCFTEDDHREKRGWYYLHEWQIEPGVLLLVGSFGIFQGDHANAQKVELSKVCTSCGADVGLRDKACHACGHVQFKAREFSAEQIAAFKAARAEDSKRAAAERAAIAARASQWATAVWRASAEIESGGHPYLLRKHLSGTGGSRVFGGNDGIMLDGAEAEDYKHLASFAGSLVVPLSDANGKIHGLQFIAEKADPKTGRDKTYWPAGMVVTAHSWIVGGAPGKLLLVAEGFATAVTLHEASGQPVAVAFAANNLLPAAKELAKRTRGRAKLLICSDDDWLQRCLECKTYTPVDDPACRACGKPHRQTNAGRARAADVAMAIPQAADWLPHFADQRPVDRKGPTDFNDLRAIEGPQIVTAQYTARLASLGWQDLATATPRLVTTPAGQAPSAGGANGGGGAKARPPALAVMDVDELVERFIPLDDGTGDYVFDAWTRKIVKRAQMLALLPAGVRNDDIKRHYRWQARGAYYLDQVGFDPAGDDPAVALNTWQGWPMQPKSGCCQCLLDLLYYLCSTDADNDRLYKWLLQWMAYPLQNPGAKMHTAVIMHGPQGTGKSTVFQALAEIYGDYATVLNQRGLEDKFNADWSDSKLFILAEEVVTRAEMWHIKNELKELVTGKWIRINPKGIAAYRQRNHLNVIYLSNADQPLPIENDDRRHCVIYTPPEQSEETYDEVQLELANGGLAAFYHHLLHLDLTGFHPRKRPPMTRAKKALILLSAQSDTRFLEEWIDGTLGLPVCPCIAPELYAQYLRWCKQNGERNPRNSAALYGAINNQRGWTKKKERIFASLTSSEQIHREIITPPLEVIPRDRRPTPGQKDIAWRTESAHAFSDAISRRGQPMDEFDQ